MRSIICEACRLPRRSRHSFDICKSCADESKKARCGACTRLFPAFRPGNLLCSLCTRTFCPTKIICDSCGTPDFAPNVDPKHCRRCHKNSLSRKWESALPRNITCVSCGSISASCRKNEMICRSCDVKLRYGEHQCSMAGCERPVRYKKLLLCERHNMLRRQLENGIKCKVADCNNLVYKKKWVLCSHHYSERRAKDDLRKYVREYVSPFPQNRRYFAELAARIDWSLPLTSHDLRRFRTAGDFLKITELPEILTWRVIDDLRPRYERGNKHRTMFIRSCLFDLGQIYAERGLIQDWNSYLLERQLHFSESTPVTFRNDVSNFRDWVLGGMLNPKTKPATESVDVLANNAEVLIDVVRSLNIFLIWCIRNHVNSLGEVDAAVLDSYLQTLLWKFRCSECGHSIPFNSSEAPRKCGNEKCEATHSYLRVKHLARNSRITIVSRLRVFFDWALLHGVVTHNPVGNRELTSGPRAFTVTDERGKSIEVAASIRRYDDNLVQRVCAYIVSPGADPTEAIIYYLVIFHLLEVSELRNLKIPSLVNREASSKESRDNGDYRYLLLPPRKPSRGRRSVRRPGQVIKFPPQTLPWLAPLLERFYEKRGTEVKAVNNEYLFVAGPRSRHNKPVSRTHLFRLVQRGSQRLLDGAINLSSLRQTAAAIFSDRSKRRSAVLTMMGYGARSATRFNYLETFSLKPKPEDQTHSGRSRRRKSAQRQRDASVPPLLD